MESHYGKVTLTRISKISKIDKISKIAIAIGFGIVICGTAMGPAFAGGHGGGKHEAQHRGGGGDHNRGHRGGGYIAPAPNYYYNKRAQLLLRA